MTSWRSTASFLIKQLTKESKPFCLVEMCLMIEELQWLLGLGFRREDKYLGITLRKGWPKALDFANIIEVVGRWIGSWGARSLSMVRRIVLIKSVLEVIPCYFHTNTYTPASTIDTIETDEGLPLG